MTILRERMLEELKRRNLAPNTCSVYVRQIKHLARHFNCSPDVLTGEQLLAVPVAAVAHHIQRLNVECVLRARGHARQCRTVYSTTRMPDGRVVRQPMQACQNGSGNWVVGN